MLSRLVEKKMKREGLSLRDAAVNANTSHTTIMRVLEGKQVDLETLYNVCNWLGVNIVDVLETQYIHTDKAKDTFLTQFNLFISSNPKLLHALRETFTAYSNDQLSSEDVDEIVTFIAYKLNVHKSYLNKSK
jgi:transcriptional regulator with XRE-family HTH domain